MRTGRVNDERIREYLLGKLSEPAMEAMERFFEDRETFAQVEFIEDELMSDYIDGNLDQEERRRFERLFLATDSRREKLLFAQALRQRALEEAASVPRKSLLEGLVDAVGGLFNTGFSSLRAPALIAASLILSSGLGWLAMDRARQLNELEAEKLVWEGRENQLSARLDEVKAKLSRQEEQLQNELRESARLRDLLQDLTGKLSLRRIRFTLQRLALRSSGRLPRVFLPPETAVIELRLQLPIEAEGYPLYRVAVTAVDGDRSFEAAGLTSRRESDFRWVDFSLVADQLPPGDYRIQLYGIDHTGAEDELSQYAFRVDHK